MNFDVTIEIPKGQRNKYEMDHVLLDEPTFPGCLTRCQRLAEAGEETPERDLKRRKSRPGDE